MSLLKIDNLHAKVEDNEILKGINLNINPGEVHAIMGPNGSGKSTLSNVLAGNDAYEITSGNIKFNGSDIDELDAHERAREGLFLAFQYPVEITGISNMYFLKAAVNAIRVHQGKNELDAMEFIDLIDVKKKLVKIRDDLLERAVNSGFSGGEKKRNEIFQMAMLEPKMVILDETDSGLDIDALKIVADGVNALRSQDRGFLVITHYQRLLDYIVPDFVHVLVNGKIVESGDKELALQLEKNGYESFEKAELAK
ncbi:MAG: Fe-S cluster assembly ATPase SufC [Pontiellaceae bacterium]